MRTSSLHIALVFACMAGPAAAQHDWTKSKWGPGDEVGAANYLKPELVVKAAGLIKTGKTYALGIETNVKTPAFPPRSFRLLVTQPGQAGTSGLGSSKTTYNDDVVEGWVGVGSQIDGLGHIGVDWVYYNGNKSADFAAADGLKKLGIHNVPPIVTRGVLLDMAAHYGTDVVREGTAFNTREIEEVARKQGVEIRLEVYDALWTAVRRKRAVPDTLAVAEVALANVDWDLIAFEPRFAAAARLSRELNHSVFDCVYLVVADDRRAPLVTADERLFEAARKARIPAQLL